MEKNTSLFDRFGGVRPMARLLDEPASNVAAWKREGRIPAIKQPHVLATAQGMNLPITANDIIFPLGPISPASATTAKAASGKAKNPTGTRKAAQ